MTSSLNIAENLIYHHRFVFTSKEEEENGDLLNPNVKKRYIWPFKEIVKNETSLREMAFSKKYDDALGTNFLVNISPIDLSLSTWSIKEEEEEVLVKGTHDSVSLIKFFLENDGQQRKRGLIAIYYNLNFY